MSAHDRHLVATLTTLTAAARDHLDALPESVRKAPYTRTFEDVLEHAEDQAADAQWAGVLGAMCDEAKR